MSKHKNLKTFFVILLPFLLLICTKQASAGASSTPKNLINLPTNLSNNNFSNLSQFQNEYHRQVASKPITSERYKSTTQSSTDSVFENVPNDLTSTSTLDYSYHDDTRGTTNVPECKGRLRLTGARGYITDGPGFYLTNLQCVWLIDSGRDNATIRIQFHQFNTECNYDYLYIFDGDSIYSPLIATLSGDMKDFSGALVETQLENMISKNDKTSSSNFTLFSSPTYTSSTSLSSETRSFEIKAQSGKAFIYFHSDTAQNMPGFYLTYSIDSCSLDCSNRGECDYKNLTCRCNPGYFGEGCEYILCPNNCTSSQHGICDKERSCICNEGFSGADCSIRSDQQNWVSLVPISGVNSPARAFHQVAIVDDIMYVIGGKSKSLSNNNMGIYRKRNTTMIYGLDIKTKKWLNSINLIGQTGVDHLAELVGHSVAAKGNKIFIYGGMAMNNTILRSLTVYDTKTNSLNNLFVQDRKAAIGSDFSPPIAVVGHTANIIDSHMYIFLGFNPLYGYINQIQKFNLADNSWSLVPKKGSSISGCIGHTSTFDPVDRLVYIYGGHHAHRTNSLYSFNPDNYVLTFLQPGPSPRYYHTAVIVDRQLIILGGNSYNTSHLSDQCFQQTYITYDLNYPKLINNDSNQTNSISNGQLCGRKWWQSIDDNDLSSLKRQGHSTVYHGNELLTYGGFNGVVMGDIRVLNISSCDAFQSELDCKKPKMGLNCYWNVIESKCERQSSNQLTASNMSKSDSNCTKSDTKALQHFCENRETCTDCLSTHAGCVWCGFLARCQHSKCKSTSTKAIADFESCYKNEYSKAPLFSVNLASHPLKDVQVNQDFDHIMECKRLENCYLCHSRPHCSWQIDGCTYNSPGVLYGPPASLSAAPQDDLTDTYASNPVDPKSPILTNSTRFLRGFDPFHNSLITALSSSQLNQSPDSCDTPCFMRPSCNACTTTRCIWCSTSEQCIDSSAYFAYHAMGQCMHYVAHMLKCPVASCAGIESCDKCLTNPKCGWLNDISGTGKGRCIEGTSEGPSFGNVSTSIETNSSLVPSPLLSSWFYTSCPLCQCNGHSYCRPANSSVCLQPCQDNTEGLRCDRCIPGYFGDPINGGICKPCECNNHAQSCHKETGKCYCSTKGITGHNCERCDDQNHYIGDLSSNGSGTCYYNLTTDYQYTFNMSKPEDHYYNDINFINVPLRKDSDMDFTIACSRLALVNITSGTSFKNRKEVHSNMECGSFRLRFPHDKQISGDANFMFFVHVHKFQTPFILQIAFSQHRLLYLPQFFFTFSSCFLFFFALSGLVWKLKHEYDIYVRRQRQFIEMEQMASRPFSTILLEMFRPTSRKDSNQASQSLPEPTPISFEPCFGNNIGVMSVFVQLPGRPNLAIGSALVTLNDEFTNSCDDNSSSKRAEKEKVAAV